MPSEHHQDTSQQIRKKIFRIERLGAMPQVLWRLIDALGDDKTSATSLENIIEGDPALTSRILSVANSAYYGLPNRITTISRAIVIMGFQEIQIIALGVGLAEVFDAKKIPANMDGEGLWLHCLAVAMTARELAEKAKYTIPSEIMVAGLLHDLGKLVLVTHLADDYKPVLDMTDQGTPYFKAEESFGLRHDTLGYWLARRWSLPGIHEAAIRDHHRLQTDDPHFHSTCFVTLADDLVKALGVGLVQESLPVNQGPVLDGAGLTLKQLSEVAKTIETKVPAMVEGWGRMLSRGEF
jgi:putative nucleotidyltransferase with HDIG domain